MASAQSAVDFSNVRASVYLGGTTTTYNPSTLNFPLETDALIPNNSSNNDFSWGLGLAYYFTPSPKVPMSSILHDVSLGLDLFSFSTTQNGQIWQFQQPDMNNYGYKLPLTSTRLLVDTEWTFNPMYKTIFPFFEAGLGFVNNSLSYSEWPIATDSGSGFGLSSHSQNNFSYTFGAGLKFPVTNNLECSVRYLYANLGNISTAITPGNFVVSPINASAYTQAWLAGLTYSF
jgi:hypothetical protein